MDDSKEVVDKEKDLSVDDEKNVDDPVPPTEDVEPVDPKQIDDLQESLDDLNKLLEKSNKLDDKNQEELLDGVKSLDKSINELELDPTINYNVDGMEGQLDTLHEDMQSLIELLTPFTESLDLVSSACSAVVTYSVFYLPLLLIVLALWWFFKQFIR